MHVAQISGLNAGAYGIPNSVDVSEDAYIASITMQQGVIRIVSKNIIAVDEPQPTYELAAHLDAGKLNWKIEDTSSCLTHNLCTK